jgi:hypothetical protein
VLNELDTNSSRVSKPRNYVSLWFAFLVSLVWDGLNECFVLFLKFEWDLKVLLSNVMTIPCEKI